MGDSRATLRILSRVGLVVGVWHAVSVPTLAAERGATIRVREPLGLARTNWPVTTGVPFPRGQWREPRGIALRGQGGRSLPLQTRVLSRWDDASVRWLLADFPLSLGPHADQAVELMAGNGASPAARVRVDERPDTVDVDTGPLRFTVPRDRFVIAEDVRLDGRPLLAAPIRAFIRADASDAPAAGQPALGPARDDRASGAPSRITVRDRGPVRAEIELRGPLARGFDYVVRLHAFAGQRFVRVLFTLVATGPAEMTAMHQLGVELPLSIDALRYRFGIEQHEPVTGAVAKDGLRLVQEDNLRFRIDGTAREGRAAGWIEASGTRGGVGIASRFFWQEYPQSFELRPRLLTYNLFAPEAAPVPIGVGAAKTHEFTVFFFDHAPSAEYAAALLQPLVARVDPTWLAASAALPNAVAPSDKTEAFLRALDEAHERVAVRTAAEEWDDAARVTCPPPGQEHRRIGAFGMLNWGDWNYPGFHDTTKGCDAWGNLEYDLTQIDALAFAASGRPAYYDAMTAAARHFMDVDVVHAQPAQPKSIGMNHPKNPLHFSFARGGVDLGHTWTEGLVSYYYFTGDERALESARGIADYLVRRMKAGIRRGNPRQWGWPQIALLAVYRATGNARYRHAALQYARRGMAAWPPTDVGNWKLGILADALAESHAVTHDPAIEQWLRAYAAAVVARPDGDQRLYPAVAYVARLSGDPALAQAARRVVERLQFGNWAKPFTITGRTGFRILSLLPNANE